MTLKTVRCPAPFQEMFERAQTYVEGYFRSRNERPHEGTIEIGGERYILVRAASMSVYFLDFIKGMYPALDEREAIEAASHVLFDVAHGIGKADARVFHKATGVDDPMPSCRRARSDFAYTGWAFVDILQESSPTPDDEYLLVYDHPHSFEADTWLASGTRTDFCTCFMNAGYSSGWCEESFGVRLEAREDLLPLQRRRQLPLRDGAARPARAAHRRVPRRAARAPGAAVNRTVYQSIVSKIGMVMPLFGKALVDMALKRRGHTADTISPVEMLELIKTEINPRLANRLQAVSTVLHAGAGVAQADAADRVVYANTVMRRMAGASDLSLPSAELFAILRAQGFIRSVRELSSLDIHDFHSPALGKDFSAIFCPIFDGGGGGGVLSVLQDVTIREAIDGEIIRFHENLRRLNDSLTREVSERQRAEADLRNVVQCIADAILVVDRAGVVVRVNPAAERLFAASEAALRGRRADELLRPGAALDGGLMARLVAAGAVDDLDVTLEPVGEQPIPVLLSGAVLRDEAGRVTGAVYTAKDMRQQRALNAKLVTTSKLAALGEMAGGIAHEINTPLTVIQGRAGQIRRMVEEGAADPPLLVAFAGKIEATTRRIARIVHGLRSFARQADRDPIESAAVASVVDETLDLCRERFRIQGVALRHESIRRLDPRPVPADAAEPGAAQPPVERLRRRRERRGSLGRAPGADARRSRRALGRGRRPGRAGGAARAGLPAVLHDQAGRSRHGARAQHLARDRAGPGRDAGARRRQPAHPLRRQPAAVALRARRRPGAPDARRAGAWVSGACAAPRRRPRRERRIDRAVAVDEQGPRTAHHSTSVTLGSRAPCAGASPTRAR